MNLELNCQRAKWGRSEGITGQPLQVAIVWQTKGSRYERRGSLKACSGNEKGNVLTHSKEDI